MAKRADTKAAVLAAAKGSGRVFETLEDAPAKAPARGTRGPAKPTSRPKRLAKPSKAHGAAAHAAAPKAATDERRSATPEPQPEETTTTKQKETPDVTTTNFAPTLDLETATANARQMFDGKTVIERSQKLAQEAAELARGNVEAMVASSRIAAQNAGTLSQDVAEVGRKGFEGASEAMKGFAQAKTPVELLRLQSEYAKSYMETVIAETTRLSETMVKLAGEAIEPVKTRLAETAEKAKSLSN